jgi:hypothetical protein
MPGDHVLVAAELIGVTAWSTEYLAPPGTDVIAVLRADPTRKEGRDQLIVLDAVVEGIDQTLEGGLPARPFEESLCLPWLRLGDPEKLSRGGCLAPIPAQRPPL